MKKRGISPLVATVLLVGFVVAVALIVFLWGRNFLQEKAEKEGALGQAQIECNSVEIEIKDIGAAENSVVNVGSTTIDGFIIRRGGTGANVVIEKKIDPLVVSANTADKNYDLDSGDEITPAILPAGAGAPLVPCTSKAKTIR